MVGGGVALLSFSVVLGIGGVVSASGAGLDFLPVCAAMLASSVAYFGSTTSSAVDSTLAATRGFLTSVASSGPWLPPRLNRSVEVARTPLPGILPTKLGLEEAEPFKEFSGPWFDI